MLLLPRGVYRSLINFAAFGEPLKVKYLEEVIDRSTPANNSLLTGVNPVNNSLLTGVLWIIGPY